MVISSLSYRKLVNPACAGMIPAPDGPLYQPLCKPRVCGDDPARSFPGVVAPG